MLRGLRNTVAKVLVTVGVLVPGGIFVADKVVEQGIVPPNLAHRYYAWEAGSLSAGELGPFGGRWDGSVASDTPVLADGTECGGGPVELLVAGERIVGKFQHTTYGYTLQVHGALDGAGVATGGIARGSENQATWDAAFDAYTGNGRWSDAYGCTGGFTAVREGKGRIATSEGRAFIVRGVRTFPATPGTQLYPGDVVAVEEGSSVSVDLKNGGLLKISEKTKFEIPSDRLDEERASGVSLFFGRAWTKAKRLIQGEPFELRTPTATAGVRG